MTVVVGLVISGCTGVDRAGGAAASPVVTLRLENPNSAPPAQLVAFADDVDKRSHGALRIEFVNAAHPGDAEIESTLIGDAKRGAVDLTWVGPRIFDTYGVTTFQPLLAPMLVDSQELQ